MSRRSYVNCDLCGKDLGVEGDRDETDLAIRLADVSIENTLQDIQMVFMRRIAVTGVFDDMCKACELKVLRQAWKAIGDELTAKEKGVA